MESLNKREFLLKSPSHPLTGFTEKPINRLVNSKQTPTILNIETNHIKRDLKKGIRDIVPLLEYQLWLEAGKMDKASFKSERGDENVSFNANIWRNFRNSAGLFSDRKSGVSESVASLYPINIPVPSQVGSNTLTKYYEQNRNIFKSEEAYKATMEKAEKEAAIMKYLRLKSEMRNPPLDYNGNILPPKNFKKYPPPTKSKTLESIESDSVIYPHLTELPTPKRTRNDSLFLNEQIKIDSTKIKMRRFMPTKIVYRTNHPDFNKVVMEQQLKGIYKSAPLNKNH